MDSLLVLFVAILKRSKPFEALKLCIKLLQINFLVSRVYFWESLGMVHNCKKHLISIYQEYLHWIPYKILNEM